MDFFNCKLFKAHPDLKAMLIRCAKKNSPEERMQGLILIAEMAYRSGHHDGMEETLSQLFPGRTPR